MAVKQVALYLTPDQHQWLLAKAGKQGGASFFRTALAELYKDFPSDTPQHGGNRQTKAGQSSLTIGENKMDVKEFNAKVTSELSQKGWSNIKVDQKKQSQLKRFFKSKGIEALIRVLDSSPLEGEGGCFVAIWQEGDDEIYYYNGYAEGALFSPEYIEEAILGIYLNREQHNAMATA